MSTAEPIPLCIDSENIRTSDVRDIRLRQQNLDDLRKLQKVMLVEEDKVLSYDEILTRILTFYSRFVPFNRGNTSPSGI
jgi:hypothetical protein